MNEWESKAREKKAHRIADALVAEADQRGESVADTVLPIVEVFALGEERDSADEAGRHLKEDHTINPPSIITWARVAELLTERVHVRA